MMSEAAKAEPSAGNRARFVACVAEGRQPLSDGALGLDAIRTVYAAYVAAEEGRRVELSS